MKFSLNKTNKIKQNSWPKGNKDPEELSYINDLNHLSGVLFVEEDAHTHIPLLGVYYFFAHSLDR